MGRRLYAETGRIAVLCSLLLLSTAAYNSTRYCTQRAHTLQYLVPVHTPTGQRGTRRGQSSCELGTARSFELTLYLQ